MLDAPLAYEEVENEVCHNVSGANEALEEVDVVGGHELGVEFHEVER